MGNLTFDNFDSRSFEQFTQALASNILGPGILIFGDGPDGGREASFNGVVPYPTVKDNWDGYIVLQAKYRLKPKRDASDANWLVTQIQADLDGFHPGSDRPPPEYYIIATNVELSGVVGKGGSKGGQQKIDELFKKYAHLGIKDFRVWHPDVLEPLVRTHTQLLDRYLGWLQPIDVLSEAFKFFKAKSPDFHQTMLTFLQRELREQRATRLQQAGHTGDSATNLEAIFTDLPYEETVAPAYISRNKDDRASHIAAELLRRISHKLDPQTLRSTAASRGPAGDRYLILGGPGQGKSTITQFLAQILRFRLLTSETLPLSSETGPVLEAIEARIQEEGLSPSGANRFPIRIDLPKLADAISRSPDGKISLIEYIADHIAAVSQRPVDTEDMREWLKYYPWALLLDGLDEVPPSGSRDELLRSIRDFWDDAAALNADVLMVVTTRPQGYNNELDSRYYGLIELSKLDSGTCMAFAGRLAETRLAAAEERKRVLDRLSEALANSTTSLLLVSPLQVAILFALIDQSGHVPRDRWSLFHEYYAVMVRREQEKYGDVGKIVRDRVRPITEIIQKSGFVLHALAELPGGANAHFTPNEFRRLVEEHMSGEGYEGPSLASAVDDITYVATSRLVFLEQRTEGEIGFEIRSLQEYMAAAFLMSGPEVKVQARLREIANRSHWQHVFKIAASKCFAASDAAQFRDTVLTICNEIDELSERADRFARAGAELALTLLEDGLAHDLPGHHRLLFKKAIEVSQTGTSRVTDSLLGLAQHASSEFLQQYLSSQLMAQRPHARSGAWKILLSLSARGTSWATKLAVDSWPECAQEGVQVALTPLSSLPAPEVLQKFEESFARAGPGDLYARMMLSGRRRFDDYTSLIAQRFPFFELIRRNLFLGPADRLSMQLPNELELSTVSLIRSKADLLEKLVLALPAATKWQELLPALEFALRPTVANLEIALRAAGNVSKYGMESIRHAVPWPLQSIYKATASSEALNEAADRVAAGEFGDETDWHEAEARLSADPITIADLQIWRSGEYFDRRIAQIGMPSPMLASAGVVDDDDDIPYLRQLIAIFEECPESGPKSSLRWIIRMLISDVEDLEISVEQACDIIFSHQYWNDQEHLSLDLLSSLAPEVLHSDALKSALAEKSEGDCAFTISAKVGPLIVSMLQTNPKDLRLLVWLLASIGDRSNHGIVFPDGVEEFAKAGVESPLSAVKTSAAILLTMLEGVSAEYLEIIEEGAGTTSNTFANTLLSVSKEAHLPTEVGIALSLGVLQTDAWEDQLYLDFLTTLFRYMGKRRTRLLDRKRWIDLGFAPETFDFTFEIAATLTEPNMPPLLEDA